MSTMPRLNPLLQGETCPASPHASTAISKENKGDSFSKLLKDRDKDDEERVTKPEKEKKHSDEDKKEEAKQELGTRLKGDPCAITPIHRFLYDLVYRDPSTWSVADKQKYLAGKDQVNLREFFTMLSSRQIKLQDLSYRHLEAAAHLNTRRQLTAFLDTVSREILVGEEANAAHAKPKSFANLKTSLQEIVKQERVKEDQIIKSIVSQLSIRKIEKGSEVSLVLNPKALGEVSLLLLVKGSQVTAKFKATHPSVRDVITANLRTLHDALSKQGLQVEALEVEKVA